MASVHGLQQLGGVRLELQVLSAGEILGTSEHFHGEIHGNSMGFHGENPGELFMRSKWRGFANLHV